MIALFLAKEHLSHMAGFKAQLELAQIFSQIGMQTLDLNKQLITDQKVLQKIAASVYLNELTDSASDLWKIFDIFPMMLLSESIIDLVVHGKLTARPKGGRPLYVAAQIVDKDSGLLQVLSEIRTTWEQQGTLLPLDGTTIKTMQPPINPAIHEVYKL